MDAAAAGLLTDSGVVLFSADLAGKPQQLRQALDAGAVLVVTDSNRRRAERWNAIRENYGYVERVDEKPLKSDPSDHRLPVFPNSGSDSQTVAQQRGVVSVEATDYGNPVGYAPADRPDYAVDGDVTTAWRVGAFSDVRGEKLKISMVHPVTTSSINVVQPITFTRNRYITKLALTFDGRDRRVVDLNNSSREKAGQTITFPKRTFSSVQLEVVEANFGRQSRYNGLSGVGFSEVRIPGVQLSEYLRLPTDLLTEVGAASLAHPLVLQLTRDRANPGEPFKQDTELGMNRTFSLPTARSFGLTGTARISPGAKDADVDRALGRPVGPEVVRADSSGHLPGDLTNRGSSAFDGDPKTVWSTGFGDQVGSWVQVSSPTRGHRVLDRPGRAGRRPPFGPDEGSSGGGRPGQPSAGPAACSRRHRGERHLARHAAVPRRDRPELQAGHRRRADRPDAGLPEPSPGRHAHRLRRGGHRGAARAAAPGERADDLPHRPADGERQAGRGFGVGVDVRCAQAGGPDRLAVRRRAPSPCAPGTRT